MAFAKLMATPAGRGIRIVAGIALIVLGLFVIGDIAGIVLAIIGIAPILAGGLNICLIAPIIGAPFSGKEITESQSTLK
jgi:hypothetical protein